MKTEFEDDGQMIYLFRLFFAPQLSLFHTFTIMLYISLVVKFFLQFASLCDRTIERVRTREREAT